METFQSQLAKKLSNALKAADLSAAGELTPASDPRFGDYQSNAALGLGKQHGENLRVLAENILAHFAAGDLCEPPGMAGPRFINFTLSPGADSDTTTELTPDNRLAD